MDRMHGLLAPAEHLGRCSMSWSLWDRITPSIRRYVIYGGVVLVAALLIFGPIFGGTDEERLAPPGTPTSTGGEICRGEQPGFCPAGATP